MTSAIWGFDALLGERYVSLIVRAEFVRLVSKAEDYVKQYIDAEWL